MRMKKPTTIILAALLVLLCGAPAASANSYPGLPEVDIRAYSAILVYAPTGEVLYEHNAGIEREPASITKIMTVLLGIEHGNLDEVITAEEIDFADITDDSSDIHPRITVGEEITFRDLLYCAMVASSNVACNMIARHVAGTVPAFMEMVNERLAGLGCEKSNFVNPHGLPADNHHTTAYDIYLMARECIKDPLFMEMAHTEKYTVGPTNKIPDGRTLITTNNLITRQRYPDYIYPYARGIKTGSTSAAGHCLVSIAEKDGLELISVVLGASVDEETKLIRSFTETRDLFEWGFNNFTIKRILSRTMPIASVKIIQGLDQNEVNLVPERSVEALVPKSLNPEDIEYSVNIFSPDGVQAPVNKNDALGELTLSYGGHTYGTIPLLSDKSVERDNRQAIQDGIGGILDRIFGSPSEDADDVSGSWQWIKWAIFTAIVIIVLYILFVIAFNSRRRKRNMRPSNYRGRKRY